VFTVNTEIWGIREEGVEEKIGISRADCDWKLDRHP
jgi:hypothetical protein